MLDHSAQLAALVNFSDVALDVPQMFPSTLSFKACLRDAADGLC